MGTGLRIISAGPGDLRSSDTATQVTGGGIRTQVPACVPQNPGVLRGLRLVVVGEDEQFPTLFPSVYFLNVLIIGVQLNEFYKQYTPVEPTGSRNRTSTPPGTPMLLFKNAPRRGATVLTSNSISLIYFLYQGPM